MSDPSLFLPRKMPLADRLGDVYYPGGFSEKVASSTKHDYKPVFAPGLSLASCEGDTQADRIEFTHERTLAMRDIDALATKDVDTYSPIPFYHAHVLWSFSLRCYRFDEDSYELRLGSIGSHLTMNDSQVGIGSNDPAGLCIPEILEATLAFIDKDGKEKQRFNLETEAYNLMVRKHFTWAELIHLSEEGTLILRIRLVIPRSYFTLSKLLKEPTTVPKQTVSLVESILRGEKPPGADWTIKVSPNGASGDRPLHYHVHPSALARISDNFKVCFTTRRPIEDIIELVPKESQTCFVPCLTPNEMPILLSLAYGIDPPLVVDIWRAAKAGHALALLLKLEVISDVLFPQWERTICEQALALDTADVRSMAVVYHLLVIVWSCPYGAMPVAKRVAIGVFADIVYINTPSGNLRNGLSEDLRRAWGGIIAYSHTATIMQSFREHLFTVTMVRKVGMTKKEEAPPPAPPRDFDVTDETPPPPPSRDLDVPTIVSIDDLPGEETNEESAKWQCTIS